MGVRGVGGARCRAAIRHSALRHDRKGSWLCENAKTLNRDRRSYSSKTVLVAQHASGFNFEIELKNIILRRVSILEFLHSQGHSQTCPAQDSSTCFITALSNRCPTTARASPLASVTSALPVSLDRASPVRFCDFHCARSNFVDFDFLAPWRNDAMGQKQTCHAAIQRLLTDAKFTMRDMMLIHCDESRSPAAPSLWGDYAAGKVN
jgi:hypothetical protein